ncbi:MAG: 2-oxoacid:acceptor oxidoreductase subunit alpha [Symbiobacterium sp.]|jgi:2-oxoglutarate ferredoxin oxidoreductase, alpha subunit (EC 1.2.7.3)|uniref:2-oxoacid:acceptor oxidoreductase subunit alpha n=1 Tax=Symbiobacterium sp. TaxID=1971213 RepID=UPI003463FFFF
MPEVARPARKKVLMQGNEAIVEGALAAGMRFFAGYPITPSTEIAELASERLPRVGGRFVQMEDEIASMAAVVGASLAGKKAMTATSGPGFSLKQENLGFALAAEVPCVVVNVQRQGPSTGLPTSPAQGDVMQARYGAHGDYAAIALCPASVGEAYRLAVRAFNLSERFRMPVILLADEIIGHLRESVALPDPAEGPVVNRARPTLPPGEHKAYRPGPDGVPVVPDFGMGYRFHVTGLIHGEDGFPTSNPQVVEAAVRRLTAKVTRHLDEVYEAEEQDVADADVVVFAYGGTARAARRAVREARAKGLKVGLYRPVTLWPFHDERVRASVAGRRAVVVPELNLGQMAREVERAARGSTRVVPVGRVSGEPLAPDEILAAIEEVC